MKHLILVTAMVLAMAGSATYADDIVHGDETKLWLYNDLAQRGLYLTPSVKLGFGERSQFFLEAGAGWYNSDFAEVSCLGIYYYYCEELDAPFYSNTVGAYLGFRAGLGKAAFVSVRAHQADFGRVSGIDSAPTNLTGPFYALFVGVGF